jgi:heme-degrading monooxygenase HmoA
VIRTSAYLAEWTSRAAANRSEQFEHAHGPDGAWSRLFTPQPGYLASTLVRLDTTAEYLTIDHWASKEAFATFTAHHRDEYQALDIEHHTLTAAETLIGRGTTLGRRDRRP